MTLAATLNRQRRQNPDALGARWKKWLGQGFHQVELMPSGQLVAAKGGQRTFAVDDAVTVLRYSGADGRGYVLVAPPPPQSAGASAFPAILNAQQAPFEDIVAAVPNAILTNTPTVVKIIGYGFSQAPVTTFGAYAEEVSDPAAGVFINDPSVALASHSWVNNTAPGAAYAPFPLDIIQATITATVASEVSLFRLDRYGYS